MDKRLINKSLLTEAELNWFNDYHSRVYQTLSPLMSGESLAWLEQATSPL